MLITRRIKRIERNYMHTQKVTASFKQRIPNQKYNCLCNRTRPVMIKGSQASMCHPEPQGQICLDFRQYNSVTKLNHWEQLKISHRDDCWSSAEAMALSAMPTSCWWTSCWRRRSNFTNMNLNRGFKMIEIGQCNLSRYQLYYTVSLAPTIHYANTTRTN